MLKLTNYYPQIIRQATKVRCQTSKLFVIKTTKGCYVIPITLGTQYQVKIAVTKDLLFSPYHQLHANFKYSVLILWHFFPFRQPQHGFNQSNLLPPLAILLDLKTKEASSKCFCPGIPSKLLVAIINLNIAHKFSVVQ